MENQKYLVVFWAALLAFWLMVPIVNASERLLDGGFETGIDSWTITNDGLEATFARTDLAARSGNYAAIFTNIDDTIENGVYTGVRLRECIDISAPDPEYTNFSFSGYIYIPATSTNHSIFRPRFRYYNSPDCEGSGASDRFLQVYNNLPTDEWVYFRVTGERPVGALGVGLWLETEKTSPADSVVYFDDLRFYDSTPTAVSLQHSAAQPAKLPTWLLGGALFFFGMTVALTWRIQYVRPRGGG